jgi:ATP diphosphatase
MMTETTSPQEIKPLLDIMRRLRDKENGCPWDLEQDFASIAPYTIEEAYEVADAVERGDYSDLKDELGDLLLQVVFHAQMADEQSLFNFGDVVDAICTKMVNRHPHVFSAKHVSGPDDVVANWESIKATERQNKSSGAGLLAGVALALPALQRAQKIQKRAALAGFDWPDSKGALTKLHEEIGELDDAETPQQQFEEFGDLLFAAVNVARHLGIDAEAALKAGTTKFERRFQAMETMSESNFASLSLDQKEHLWKRVKTAEHSN